MLRSSFLNVSAVCFARPEPKLCKSSSALQLRLATVHQQESMKPIDEADVGITCYASQIPGFRGILKQRYSDFIVHEVDCDGVVVRLTCCDAPPEIDEDNGNSNPMAHEERRELCDSTDGGYSVQVETFKSLAGEADAKALKVLLDQINPAGTEYISPITLSPDPDKMHRAAVHNFFKTNFKFFITDTVEGLDPLSKCVRVRFCSGEQDGKGRNSKKRKNWGSKRTDSKDEKVFSSLEGVLQQPFDHRGAEDWPEGTGKFLRFHLYKENKDTQEALAVIGKMLGIQQRSFGFAGTKDKRAISTQRVTVFKQRSKRLAALNDRLIGIKIGDFCYVREGLVLGQLFGNRFTITLRGVVSDSEDIIKAAVDELGRNGFINYFGLQRFGSGSVPTHVIGGSLLRGEWKAAVGLILDPKEGERDAITEAREYFKDSGDIDGTLRRLPRYLVAERAILQCLKKCPGNYLQAVKAIPRTLRMMYVHSYQSYLWNHAASLRVQKLGINKVVVGDLVYCKGASSEKGTKAVTVEFGDDSHNYEYELNNLSAMSEMELPEEQIDAVKALSAEDILSGEYTFDDIILPLPGSRVIYPTNEIASVYHDLAKKDGISLMESSHNVKIFHLGTEVVLNTEQGDPSRFLVTAAAVHRDMDMAGKLSLIPLQWEFSITSMTGGYRRVFQHPIDFEWELLKYTDSNIPLTKTDFDAVAKSRPQSITKEKCSTNGDNPKNYSHSCSDQSEILEYDRMSLSSCHGREGEREEGLAQVEPPQTPQTALKLSFTLPASCYATMAIRELLKTSTSVAFHKTLNG